MPFITVKVPKKEMKLDIKKLGNDISEKASLEIHRVNLMVDYMDEDTCFKGAGNDYPVVHVAAGAGNGKEFIHNLMKTAGSLVEDQLGLDAGSVFVYAHPIEKDYLYVMGNFR